MTPGVRRISHRQFMLNHRGPKPHFGATSETRHQIIALECKLQRNLSWYSAFCVSALPPSGTQQNGPRNSPREGFPRSTRRKFEIHEVIPMSEKIAWIDGPSGFLSVRELPTSHSVRWSPQRKAEVVLAVRKGVIS